MASRAQSYYRTLVMAHLLTFRLTTGLRKLQSNLLNNRDTSMILLSCSRVCTIDFENMVVVTGGEFSKTSVTKYGLQGDSEQWPSLLTGRFAHACGHFISSMNKMVILKVLLIS